LHSGSALAFQARGAGSIPAIRSIVFFQRRKYTCSWCVFSFWSEAASKYILMKNDLRTLFKTEEKRAKHIKSGGRSQVVKAVDCDSTIRGFNPRRSPIEVSQKAFGIY